MGRFKAEAIIVRELEELTIIFWDARSIYVYPADGGRGVIFHRWYAPLGSYKEWGRFRRRILRRRHLSMLEIHEIANECGVLAIGTDRRLDLSKSKIEKRS